MIYIGSVLGGPELAGSQIDRAIRRIVDLRGPVDEGDTGSLDVVFHIPGSIVKPDYRGLRTGKFSHKEKMLMVQISVPPEVVKSDDAEAFIIESLKEAVRQAKARFVKAGIRYPEEQYLSEIEEIAFALRH